MLEVDPSPAPGPGKGFSCSSFVRRRVGNGNSLDPWRGGGESEREKAVDDEAVDGGEDEMGKDLAGPVLELDEAGKEPEFDAEEMEECDTMMRENR